MNKIDYKSAYESVLIANGMLRQENKELKERISYLERSCERKEETIRNERDENIELSNKIDKAIELLSHFSGCQICEHTQELAIKVEEILKDSDVDD